MEDKGTIYLIHFLKGGVAHAGHYLGWTNDLKRRLKSHGRGRGARLMEVLRERGIPWLLVRTWQGTRGMERGLKRRKNARKLCPLCRQIYLERERQRSKGA